jgi:hypothetical protein
MKITPDYKGRDDEYDDNTVRYYESINKKGYFYELYVMIDDVKAKIIITNGGVSIDFVDGRCVHTNIIPERLFKENELTWPKLRKIIRIIENTEAEGMVYSQEEMREKYILWKSLGKP